MTSTIYTVTFDKPFENYNRAFVSRVKALEYIYEIKEICQKQYSLENFILFKEYGTMGKYTGAIFYLPNDKINVKIDELLFNNEE